MSSLQSQEKNTGKLLLLPFSSSINTPKGKPAPEALTAEILTPGITMRLSDKELREIGAKCVHEGTEEDRQSSCEETVISQEKDIKAGKLKLCEATCSSCMFTPTGRN